MTALVSLIKRPESSGICFCMCNTASCMLYCVQCQYTARAEQHSTWDQSCPLHVLEVSFRTYSTDGYERLAVWNGIWPHCYVQGTVLRCAFILRVRVGMYICTYYRGMKYEVWSMRYEVWSMKYEVWSMKYGGPPDLYIIASHFSMELTLFRCGLSAIVRSTKVYVISRVVTSRFDL